MGGSAQGPFSHTAGGAVGSQDHSPDAVEWATSEDTVGHRTTEPFWCGVAGAWDWGGPQLQSIDRQGDVWATTCDRFLGTP